MTDQEQLIKLIGARHGCITLSTFEDDYAMNVVRDVVMSRNVDLWMWTITQGLRDGLVTNGPTIADTEHPAAALYNISKLPQRGAICVMLDVIGHLKDERTLRMLREAIDAMVKGGSCLVLIDSVGELPPAIIASSAKMELSFPDEKELEQIIKEALRCCNDEARVDVNISRRGLQTIVRNLRGLTRRQARQIIIDTVTEDRRFDEGDINRIMAEKRKTLQGTGLLEYVESPVDISEIGGMQRLKGWLNQRQQSLSDEAIDFGLPAPRGVLMLGVQGAGKSLSAKAVATAWQRPLLRMDPSTLYDRYIGETERRLRDTLRQAELMAPIILWIDEIEKAFASAASQSSDGGLSKRMFGTLLTWMQEHTAPVFVVATANDIEALPPELLRKGRFDEIFFVDLPGLEARASIFSIHIKKRKRDPEEFDLPALAAASEGFSGAEIEQAVIAGLHDAFSASAELTTERVLKVLQASPPLSVTMAERMEALRHWAKGRCVMAE